MITLQKLWLQVRMKWKVKRAKVWNLLEVVALHFSHDLAPSYFLALYMAHAATTTYGDYSLQESILYTRRKRDKMYIFVYMCFCRSFSVPKMCLPYVFESLTVHLWRKVRLPLLLPKVILIFCHLFNTREKRGKRREDGREESPKT